MARRFLRQKSTPAWTILCIDLGIVLISLLLAYLLSFNFTIPKTELQTFYWVFPYAFGVRLISFFIGNTYRGIIRYTSSKDAERVFGTAIIGSLFFVLANLVRYYFFDQRFFIPFS